MAEGLGIVAPVTKCAAETTYAMPRLARIQWDTREAVGWPETMATTTMVVARATGTAGSALRSSRGVAECLDGLLALH